MKKLFFISILVLISIIFPEVFNKVYSQSESLHSCGFDIIHNKMMNNNIAYKRNYLKYEKSYSEFIKKEISTREKPSFTLPVVVHIIHNGGEENITDQQVMRGIENLNAAFANIGYYNQNTGIETGIQFCLAQRNPGGTKTSGINRIQSSLTNVDINVDDKALKDLIRWDPYHYINIWLVKNICDGNNCNVVGYSNFPISHGRSRDGLVVEAAFFGGTKSSSVVQIHEMGHYLGLFHTFQGGCKNDNCQIDGDKVCDTPPDNSTFPVKCGDDFNSCNTDTNSGFNTDQNDMYWNYMDYGDFRCMSAFTEGQRVRMVYSIKNFRKSLLDSKACFPPCTDNIIANFDIPNDTIYLGENVNFTNLSSNNATIFSWELDGNEISTNKNLNYQFNKTGEYIITLKVYNSDKSCYDIKSKSVIVLCPATVKIKTNSINILAGETVVFEAKSKGISNVYDWYVDENLKATGQQFSYTFDKEGVYKIKVISQNSNWDCSDSTFIKIIVSCPVKAEFDNEIFFPELNEPVHFTNTSVNANLYKWTINDNLVSNHKDLDYTFSLPGEYTVCLTAENGDCKKKYCSQIFVLDENTDDCEDVYLKRIGDPEIDETCYDFSFLDDDKIAIVGSYDNRSLIFEIDKNAKVISSNTYDFMQGDEYIYNTFIDNEGYLLMSGIEINTSYGRSAFILKYDINNKQVIWNKVIVDSKLNYPIFWTLNQLPNGNYLCAGKTYGNGCDALIAEINNQTGKMLWKKTFDTGSCEGFLKTLYINGNIFGTGRFAINSSSETKFRGVIMKMNSEGKELWTKNYIFPVSGSSRIYPFDMIQDNGIVVIFLGDENGANLNDSKMQVIKIDLNGNLLWAKGFFVNNSKYNRAEKILNLPDGYIIAGDYVYSGNNRKVLLYKIDKLGNLIWSKSYKIGLSSNLTSIKIKKGYIYCMGITQNNNDKDIFIMKLDLNGNMPVVCDVDIEEPTLQTKNFNLFSEPITVKDLNNNMPYNNDNYTNNSVKLIEENICKKDCIDTCSIAPDASFVILDAKCKKDSFILTFEICNYGNSTLLPNIPIAFYDDNPVLNNSKIIDVFLIPDSIPKNDCKQYNYILKAPFSNNIYGFVNDNGTSSTPFIPDRDLPNTGTMECNWNNNLNEIMLEEAKTHILDLGNDTTMCISGIVNLNAGSGFESYKWNDGSTDSIFTAWNPGKYWVDVVDLCGNLQSDTINITVDPATIIDLGDDLHICPGEEVSLQLNGFENITWNINGELINCQNECKVAVKPDSSITVFVVANDNKGCYSSDTINIYVFDTDGIKLPQDTTINLGDEIRIVPIGMEKDNFSYKWSPPYKLSCIDCFSTIASPYVTTTYFLNVTDENGCSSSDDIVIKVKKDITIYIPNIFTPDGDGINDIFYIKGKSKGIKGILTFRIYDRWGELIFEDGNFQINDPLHGWDGTFKGKKVNPDVFVYVAVIELLDNTKIIKKGDITVLR